MNSSVRTMLLLIAVTVFAPDAVLAYGGPGSVISGIGALLAAVAALLATLFGFIWFPLKRLYKSMTGDETVEEAAESQPSE